MVERTLSVPWVRGPVWAGTQEEFEEAWAAEVSRGWGHAANNAHLSLTNARPIGVFQHLMGDHMSPREAAAWRRGHSAQQVLQSTVGTAEVPVWRCGCRMTDADAVPPKGGRPGKPGKGGKLGGAPAAAAAEDNGRLPSSSDPEATPRRASLPAAGRTASASSELPVSSDSEVCAVHGTAPRASRRSHLPARQQPASACKSM